MRKLLFLDVEATGTDKDDRLLQLAYIAQDDAEQWTVDELFKPPVPIKLEAMAIHHVTEKMVAEKPAFEGSETQASLRRLANDGFIFIAHNAPYDLGMLAKEGVEFPRFIDTLKVAKHLDTDGRFANHQLQYLRYFYGIEVEATAHDAMGDILVLRHVFWRLVDELSAQLGDKYESNDKTIELMDSISKLPSLIKTFRFGKHDGEALADVAKSDRGYLEWLLEQKLQKPEGEEDWIYSLRQYLKK